MASQMEWSHEYCLSCDRQLTEGGTYCSQACRLAELEKSNAPTSPSNLSSSAGSATSSSSHGFYLPPALNFTALKAPSSSRGFDVGPATTNYYSSNTNTTSYFSQQHASSTAAASTSGHAPNRSLTPSSSRSSLASAGSQTAPGISKQATQQLDSYVRAFDHTRDVRKMSRRYTQY